MSTVTDSGVTSADYTRPYRPRPIALANRVGEALRKAGLAPAPFTVGNLITEARKKTGLFRFDDESFCTRRS